MRKHRETTAAPDMPGRPKDWRDQIKADLATQVEAGGTQFPANNATIPLYSGQGGNVMANVA